jgi:bifunctional DNA-binding transcriptional regulator/antitoxin component of YhaV-PrlF toxin-antitoxin module
MKIRGKVWRGNKEGAGFVRLTKNTKHFRLNDNIKVNILDGNSILTTFYASLASYKNYIGFYIPQKICSFYKLLGKEVEVEVEKVNGFYTKLGNDGRLYIPYEIASKLQLKQNELILIEGQVENITKAKLCKIKVREKNDKKEYFCIFSSELKNKSGLFVVKSKLPKQNLKEPLRSILKDLNYGILNNHKIVILQHKSELYINPQVELDDNLFYYFGSYFADGTKKNIWAITASTFDQAKFYKEMHEKLILNPEYESSYISISLKKDKKVDLEEIKKLWKKACGIEIKNIKTRIINENSLKTHPYGSFVIRENRKVTLLYYQKLLNYVINYIINKKDKKAALNFICGVLEGDGSPSARKRGYINIASNKEDVVILQKILKIADVDYSIQKYGNRVFVRLNALELLSKLELIWNKIFAYYPERRKKFIERFSRIGAVRFIIGEQNYCASWVKSWLRKNGILNENYELTSKGKRIKNLLKKMIKAFRNK